MPPSTAQIRDKLSIEYVCAWYGITLDSDGTGLCPFHDDHHPSFRLYLSDEGVQRWHCYPCATGGDVIDLIARKEEVGFTSAMLRARSLLDQLPDAWEPEVHLEEPSRVQPSDWREDLNALQENAARNPDFLAGALKLPREAGSFIYNRYLLGLDSNGALAFPYWDEGNYLVGCKVRYPNGERVSLPGSKYPVLYGAWRPIPTKGFSWDVLLAEGETDAIWAAWHARPMALAVYGTPGAGTQVTTRMIETVYGCRQALLGFDGDEAGDAATERWKYALAQRGIPSHRLPVPRGTDLRSCNVEFEELLRRPFA